MVARTVSQALALLLVTSPSAFALGLGDIRLLSALNAPLNAEIELVGATPEELTGVRTQLASRETFARYGLDWPAFLANVTVQLGQSRDGKDVIQIRSAETVTEPFLTLLVEVDWARGKLVREYTMLLDPPVYTPGEANPATAPVAPQASAPATTAQPAPKLQPEPEESVAAAPSSESTPAPTPETVPAPAALAGEKRVVQRGDTLSGIAGEIASGDMRTTRRWMVAIYQANPAAFAGNMNILRSGVELSIPESTAIETISVSQANAEITQQRVAWQGSDATAAPPAGTEPPAQDAAEQAGQLKLVPPAASATVTEPAAGNTGTDKSATPSGPGTAALQSRVRELEAQLQESRRLVELRNAEVAQLQARLSGGTPPPAPTDPTLDEAPLEAPMEPPAVATTETPPATEPTEPAVEEPTPPPPPVVEPPAPAATAAAEESWFDVVKRYWWIAAGLVAALLALAGLRAYRSRQQNQFDDSLGKLATGATAAREFTFGDEPASTTSESRGFAERDIVVEESGTHERPRFDPSGESAIRPPPNITTEDTISSESAINLDQGDPLAEADFHMAYGLYDQAADLVRIAITREPARRDLKLKLLEVFFVWGNSEQFLQTARELASTRDQAAPGEWEKIVIMGKQLAPDDALFVGGGGVQGAAAGGVDLDLDSSAGGQGRVDFDLLGEPVPGGDGLDLDIGSALGDKDRTTESPTRTTDAHRVLSEGPTVEQPSLMQAGTSTIRQKVETAVANRPTIRPEQTAEVSIDDLGLDLSALETLDQPGLAPEAPAEGPTLVAGLDDRSRRLMEDAQRRGSSADDEPTAPPVAATGKWQGLSSDMDPTLPPTMVQSVDDDVSMTARLAALREGELDFDVEDDGAANTGRNRVDIDVGTATSPDTGYTATQRVAHEELALPDLEPATMSEVGTKLDLARAYIDMGDPEGARNILQEVMQEGSASQKQEAQRLVDSLPG
jgi:pilus assembly protein FimV